VQSDMSSTVFLIYINEIKSFGKGQAADFEGGPSCSAKSDFYSDEPSNCKRLEKKFVP